MSDAAMIGAPATASRDGETRAGEAPRDQGKVVTAIATIARSPRELYDFWRDFSNLPKVMENIASIEVGADGRSRWTVKAPAGRTVSWDAIVTDDRPGRSIAWESAEGGDVRSSGRIEFHDAPGRGTIVRAVIGYDPPGGAIGGLIAKLFQREPAIQARRDLRRLKQYMETGEVATSSRTLAHHAEHKAG